MTCVRLPVKIRKTIQSISPYLYNALQIQLQILVQITSNSYAAELQKQIKFFGKILYLHCNGVCLHLRFASAPRPTPYFWS